MLRLSNETAGVARDLRCRAQQFCFNTPVHRNQAPSIRLLLAGPQRAP